MKRASSGQRRGFDSLSGGLSLQSLGLLLLVLSVGCGPRPGASTKAEIILRGGGVLTLEGSQPDGAVAIADGRILAVGTPAQADLLRSVDTRGVQLSGDTVVPGFVDHHVHLLNMGMSLLNQEKRERLFLDLGSIHSLEELGERVRKRTESTPPGRWILGKGWSQAAWGETSLPVNTVLNEAAPHHPVYLTRLDGHAGWANETALRMAGIGANQPNPPGGVIVRRPDGSPTGILLERANEQVLALIPPPSDGDIRRAFRLGAEALAALGVTEAFDAGFLRLPGVVGLNADFQRELELLVQEDAEHPLPIRLNLMIPAPSRLAETVMAQPDHFRHLSPRLAVTHVKLFADGAMGSRGAAMSQPYQDDASTQGVFRMTRQEIATTTERALDAGLDVAIHAIGDAAIDRVLDVYEEILQKKPGLKPTRLRIEHFSYAQPEDIERAARLGVALSIQPNFVAPDDDGETMEDARVGKYHAERVYPWGKLAELGAILVGGSDYFAKPGPPLLDFHSASTRSNLSDLPAEGWHPEQSLPRLESLKLMTSPLPPGGDPRKVGLHTGDRADLAILSDNPLTVPASRILSIRVRATIVDGRVVYSDGTVAGLPTPE